MEIGDHKISHLTCLILRLVDFRRHFTLLNEINYISVIPNEEMRILQQMEGLFVMNHLFPW